MLVFCVIYSEMGIYVTLFWTINFAICSRTNECFKRNCLNQTYNSCTYGTFTCKGPKTRWIFFQKPSFSATQKHENNPWGKLMFILRVRNFNSSLWVNCPTKQWKWMVLPTIRSIGKSMYYCYGTGANLKKNQKNCAERSRRLAIISNFDSLPLWVELMDIIKHKLTPTETHLGISSLHMWKIYVVYDRYISLSSIIKMKIYIEINECELNREIQESCHVAVTFALGRLCKLMTVNWNIQ